MKRRQRPVTPNLEGQQEQGPAAGRGQVHIALRLVVPASPWRALLCP